eukprot:928039-Prymnesium_polylepis.1
MPVFSSVRSSGQRRTMRPEERQRKSMNPEERSSAAEKFAKRPLRKKLMSRLRGTEREEAEAALWFARERLELTRRHRALV